MRDLQAVIEVLAKIINDKRPVLVQDAQENGEGNEGNERRYSRARRDPEDPDDWRAARVCFKFGMSRT